MMTKEEKNSIASIIYERYSVGEISLDEREDLLKELNNKYIKENTLVEDFEIDEDVLDKLNMFKESVYDKYARGEITLETREKLITRANEEFADMYMESDQVNIFKKKMDELRRKNSHKRDDFKKKKMNKFNNNAIAAIKQIIEKNERNLKGLIFCYPHYTHLMRKDAADAVKQLRDIIEEIDPVQKSVEENKDVVNKYKKTSDEIGKTFKKYEEGIKGYMIQVHVGEFYKNLCEFAKHMTDDINWLESIDKNMYDIVTARSKKIKDKAIYNALNSMYSDYCQFSLFILDLYTTEIYSYLRGISILNKYNKQHKEHELTPEAQRIKNVDNDPMLNSLMKKGSKNKNGYYLDFTDDSNPKDSYTTRKYNLYTNDSDDHIKESAYERYYNGEISLDEFITEGFIKTKIDEIKAKKDKKNELEIEYSIKNAASSDLDKFYKNCDFAIFTNKKFNDKDAKNLSKKLYSIDGFNKSIKTINFFIVDGKTMNKKYDLNASKYKDNDILIIFPLNLFKTTNSIVIAKQMTNSRYFNDIVDNNEYREVQAGHHKMSEQVEHIDKYFKSLK
jgi:hypothetical protein